MLTFVAQVVALVVGTAAGWRWPRANQPLLHRDTAINIANGALLYPIRLALVALGVDQIRVGLIPTAWSPHPVFTALFAFVLLDLTRYLVHRADHRIPFLWSFHRVHHSTERMDATAGLRMHVVDFLQLSAIPVVLFGVLLDSRDWPEWILPAIMVPGILFDSFEHANLRFPLEHPVGRLWNRVLNNPHFHSWHHTRDGSAVDGNYSNTLIIWDRLFGTDVSQDQPPTALGLGGDQRLANDLIGLQLLRGEGAR